MLASSVNLASLLTSLEFLSTQKFDQKPTTTRQPKSKVQFFIHKQILLSGYSYKRRMSFELSERERNKIYKVYGKTSNAKLEASVAGVIPTPLLNTEFMIFLVLIGSIFGIMSLLAYFRFELTTNLLLF